MIDTRLVDCDSKAEIEENFNRALREVDASMYTLPQASSDALGGIKAATKTSAETEEVKIDPDTGKLYGRPGITQAECDARYLQLTGGTVSGEIVITSTGDTPLVGGIGMYDDGMSVGSIGANVTIVGAESATLSGGSSSVEAYDTDQDTAVEIIAGDNVLKLTGDDADPLTLNGVPVGGGGGMSATLLWTNPGSTVTQSSYTLANEVLDYDMYAIVCGVYGTSNQRIIHWCQPGSSSATTPDGPVAAYYLNGKAHIAMRSMSVGYTGSNTVLNVDKNNGGALEITPGSSLAISWSTYSGLALVPYKVYGVKI